MAGKVRRENLRSRLLHRGIDVLINWLALTLAYLVKEKFEIGIRTEPINLKVVIHTFIVVGIIWLVAASLLETYLYKRRLFQESVNLISTLAITIAFFTSYIYFSRPFEGTFEYPRYIMTFYALFGAFLLVLGRLIKFNLQRSLHRWGYLVHSVIIVGTGKIAQRLANAFKNDHTLGYEFIGYVNEPGQPNPETPDSVGSLDDLEDIVRKHNADEVIVALPGHQHQEILNIANRCQNQDIRIRVVPDLFEVIMIRATLTELYDIPLIGLRDPVITGYQYMVKRCFDFVAASICLIASLPLFALIAVVVKLDSKGKIFFAQTRVGENGKLFRMYKFRSMVADAEEQLPNLIDLDKLEEPTFKIKNDPRVTRTGKILRRTSLDELPQLINVLKGDMSMVGPRPEEVQVVEHYQLWHRKRLSVKPGITGPMQVSGRGELPLDERIKLELMYISNYSILEDIKYLLKTIPAVATGTGAY